ncbi:pyrroline-5-carboxylate reductase [Clostridia bacterium]|nr:pyrroline-5-carboxylate reductase [Clostridia bacterium]
MTKTISFLGAGHLPEAIIKGLLGSGEADASRIMIFDKFPSQYTRYNGTGVLCAESLAQVLDFGNIVFLIVKPQDFKDLLPQIKSSGSDLIGKLFISTAAGITLDYIASFLGDKAAIVRTMPNTPLALGAGMTALARNKNVTDDDFTDAKAIFSTGDSDTIVIPEDKMNAVTSVNGSSPAYVYLFAKAMADGAESLGFTREDSLRAVIKSLEGSILMLKNSGKTPDELVRAVAVPGGTTEKAVDSFNADNLTDIVRRAMEACTLRADELTNQYSGH